MLSAIYPYLHSSLLSRILAPANNADVLLSVLSVFVFLTLLFAVFRLVTRSLFSPTRYHDPRLAKTPSCASAPPRKGVKPNRAAPSTPVQAERQTRGRPAHSSTHSRDTSQASTSSTTDSTPSTATLSSTSNSELEPERIGFFATLRTMIATTLPRPLQLPLPELATLSLAPERVSATASTASPTLVPAPPNAQTVSPSAPASEAPLLNLPEAPWPVKQPYDAFLVLDVEATCEEGTDFNWPNEIIEWPVCLLRWRSKDKQGRAKELYIVDEFRSFVKPTWKPELSAFCTSLTGITQTEVNRAPKFAKMLESFKEFMVRNGLIDPNGEKLVRFTWCTDGPFDIRDFVVKQCFISKIQMPEWLKGDILDVRKTVNYYLSLQETGMSAVAMRQQQHIVFPKPGMLMPKRRSLNISQQLRALSLPAFVGRQHSGIDDTRNIARIVTELGKRGIRLEPNTTIYPGRRWQWMGKPGQILEEYCFI